MSTSLASASSRKAIPAAALLGVLGVVYGDIGTSPLYAFQTSLEHFTKAGFHRWEVLGILSLIFWSLVLIVTVKYVLLVMRADNRGEGGILALMALAQRVAKGERTRAMLALLGIAGACLLFGDGVITPAISVLSAVEGLEVVAPSLKAVVLPISVAIIIGLFLIQSRGTGTVGRLFGPVMVVWFLAIGVLGLAQIVTHPFVAMALSPSYGIELLIIHRGLAFLALGSVVLAVTGAEALYADMGHFGRAPIRRAWLTFVLPALVLNYFGQGALVLDHPKAAVNPFYLLAPGWLQLPMVILATMATVIASQALISGAFSMARQSMQLGLLPRMAVLHTSAEEEGQIYVPQINTMLMVGVLVLVLSFKSSNALASAYGIAVTGTFICTGMLAIVVFRRQFHWSRPAAIGAFGGLFILDLLFFIANLLKFFEGGWVPLAIAVVLMAMITSWRRGRELLLARWKSDSLPLASFVARLPSSRTMRVPGMAIFLTGNQDYVPTALLHNLKHNKVLHEHVLFVTVLNEDVPEVPAEERSTVAQLGPGIHRVIVRYGFMESPNLPRDLAALGDYGIDYDPMQASYFLNRETLVAAAAPKMPAWRLWLFLLMARNAVPATEFFRIPSDRVIEMGVRVAI